MSSLRRARRRPLLAGLLTSYAVLVGLPGEAHAKPKPRKPPATPPPPVTAPESPAPRPASPPAPPSAEVRAVDVTVVEVAGSRAFIQPGGAAGIHRGGTVLIRRTAYRVVESSDSFAVVEMGDEPLREQDRGRATAGGEDALKAPELPKPRPASTWERAWTPAEAPADSQRPRFVPLGGDERNHRFDVRFSVAAGGMIPLGGQVGSPLAYGELNARLHAEPFAAPLKLDFDGSLQGWVAADLASRVGGPTRSVVFVRELLASYSRGGFYAGLGRMRYAASTLGTLDGARAQKDLGDGFSLGAFGGLLPNPLNGAPSLDAQRFGVEARYSRPDLGLRPEAALVLHGSMFQGALDERRLSAVFGLYPGPSRVGGYIEVSSFDPGNPWNQPAVAVTAAGIEQSLRLGPVELGARFDVRQPELSRWLASYLPASWFCVTTPAPGGANPALPEPCNGGISSRAFGEADARVVTDRFSLSLGGTTVKDLGLSDAADMIGGLATGRVMVIPRVLRVDASGSYSHATYVDMYGGTAGPGLVLFDDALDVSIYYRLSMLSYRSVTASLFQNGAGGAVAFFPNASVFFTVQGEGISGDDVKALTLFGTATWRPRL